MKRWTTLLAALAVGGFVGLEARAEEPSQIQMNGQTIEITDDNPALLEEGVDLEDLIDPFCNKPGGCRGDEPELAPAPGLPGMQVKSLRLVGILAGSFGRTALLEGTDKKVYVVEPGQQFLDGKLEEVQENLAVFQLQSFDSLGREQPPAFWELRLHQKTFSMEAPGAVPDSLKGKLR